MPAHELAHVALMLLMIASLATAVVIARLRKRSWLARHRLVAATGAILGVAGAATMAIAKQVNGWPHLVTAHSRAGLSALAIVLASVALGTLLLAGRAGLRLPHRIAGAAAIALAVVAATLKLVLAR